MRRLRQFDKAIEVFKKTLEINPLHASAEFGLARALQRTGHTAEAREHFARFQHLTSTKISSALGLSYGEQGHYSIVTAVEEPETIERAMIPVRLVAQPMEARGPSSSASWTTTGGACMIDAMGSGQMDLVLMQSGDQAIRVLHNRGDGNFEELGCRSHGAKGRPATQWLAPLVTMTAMD